MVNASIITIGDELLIGQVIDTNSAYIAKELNKAGIFVKRRVAVGDNENDILAALDEESRHAEIILLTGGLGPTSDDITKPLLCKYFNGKMIVNEAALENVKYLFEKVFKRPITEVNLKQAEVPDVCIVIQNKRGSAPGMWFVQRTPDGEKGDKIFVSMPGVPNEMQGMMIDVIEKLKGRFKLPVIIHKTLLTAGIGESMLAERIKDFEASLPSHIKLAYLPNYGMVRLRLSSSGNDKDAIENEMNLQFEKLKILVKEYLVTDEDEPMEKVIGKILAAKNKTLSTAESCTGGYIAHLITTHPGSSKYFKGSVISYDNDVKENVLKVNNKTLQTFGAVSEETVIAMLKGSLDVLKTDYAIAVSGIMGPDGGSEEKPVGTVWIAVGNKNKQQTQQLNLRFDRMRNIQITAMTSLNLLRKFIIEN
ncbi:MAG TPA: CinA family nicotinamide mononucleotide deamidase-related protein [Chitinophagaceae bacterium]|nr:CinA family nicotinamide mononucleotide deamidase-related protein [Chitinophagaceae bacterium]